MGTLSRVPPSAIPRARAGELQILLPTSDLVYPVSSYKPSGATWMAYDCYTRGDAPQIVAFSFRWYKHDAPDRCFDGIWISMLSSSSLLPPSRPFFRRRDQGPYMTRPKNSRAGAAQQCDKDTSFQRNHFFFLNTICSLCFFLPQGKKSTPRGIVLLLKLAFLEQDPAPN